MSKKEGVLGDPASQGRLRNQERNAEETRKADLRAVMSMPQGRRYLWRLIDGICGTFGESYTGNSQTFHNEGRRSVGIHIMTECQRDFPDEYVLMLREELTDRMEKKKVKEAVTTTSEDSNA